MLGAGAGAAQKGLVWSRSRLEKREEGAEVATAPIRDGGAEASQVLCAPGRDGSVRDGV